MTNEEFIEGLRNAFEQWATGEGYNIEHVDAETQKETRRTYANIQTEEAFYAYGAATTYMREQIAGVVEALNQADIYLNAIGVIPAVGMSATYGKIREQNRAALASLPDELRGVGREQLQAMAFMWQKEAVSQCKDGTKASA